MQARDNPFATERVERLLAFDPTWADTSWESLERRWENLGQRAALTGRHGAGKSTFLDAWKSRLLAKGNEIISLALNSEHSSLSSECWDTIASSTGKTIILDGEEQLSWRQRRKFYHLTKRSSGLLVSRHNPGKLPALIHLDPGFDILQRCVQKLAPLSYVELAPMLPKWWKLHDANTRDVLLRCYDAVGSTSGRSGSTGKSEAELNSAYRPGFSAWIVL